MVSPACMIRISRETSPKARERNEQGYRTLDSGTAFPDSFLGMVLSSGNAERSDRTLYGRAAEEIWLDAQRRFGNDEHRITAVPKDQVVAHKGLDAQRRFGNVEQRKTEVPKDRVVAYRYEKPSCAGTIGLSLLNEIRRLKLLYKQSKILLSGQSQRKERLKNGFVKLRSAGTGA